MQHIEQWIGLPQDLYPECRSNIYSGFAYNDKQQYIVAEFQKKYVFSSNILRAELRFSGDASFQFFCNDKLIATGPPCVGGDFFIGNDTPRENFYAYETMIKPHTNALNFFARVQMLPYQICEYSKGQGGFMLSAILTFEDGSQKQIFTDQTWLVRKNNAYSSPCRYDGRLAGDSYLPAEILENIWHTSVAPIPVREEYALTCKNSHVTVTAGEEKVVRLEFDKIWSGFVQVNAVTQGEVTVTILCRELDESPEHKEELVFSNTQEYRSFCLQSAGNITAVIKNNSATNAEVRITFLVTHYPVITEVETVTSNPDLNAVLQTCKHTLKICRQTHHLDSPRHCEPLACTGDYYIESLMTPFSFGDMRLAEFDLLRTAVMLENANGRLFHTSYSLIWVKMLYDVYMFTGNVTLLQNCQKALVRLLNRFDSYLGENDLIENPPDYLFIDWIYIDGYSMHHPPKALGQTCLNMFYFGALDAATKIFTALNDLQNARSCDKKKERLRTAINELLFDRERGVYFEGLNTPTKKELIGFWMPENTQKRYYLKHSNILAAYFGVCDDKIAKLLVDKILSDQIEGDCQPYFLHYLLEAVYRLDLRDKYTLKILELWKPKVKECSKGLVEGFVAPEPTYTFDHSHAWGGTPLYSLPKALSGLEILEPGMKSIRLSPNLLGLEYAVVELLTPYGKVICKMKDGKTPEITYPDAIKCDIILS